jgi:co-chaperonin GroES (HSP10)
LAIHITTKSKRKPTNDAAISLPTHHTTQQNNAAKNSVGTGTQIIAAKFYKRKYPDKFQANRLRFIIAQDELKKQNPSYRMQIPEMNLLVTNPTHCKP